MSSIDRESEDIFAGEEYTDDEEESRCEDADEEEEDDASCELTAAVALTSLVGSESRDSREGEASEDSKASKVDQEMELHIPQRFTKSGRKRAVSFPLKVRILMAGYSAEYLARLNDIFTHTLLPADPCSLQCSS
jgi:hypothetical protein